MIGTWQGIIEDDEQPVTNKPLKSSLIFDDMLPQTFMILPEYRHDLFRLGGLGECGEPSQITKYHRHFTAVALKKSRHLVPPP